MTSAIPHSLGMALAEDGALRPLETMWLLSAAPLRGQGPCVQFSFIGAMAYLYRLLAGCLC